jgi:hypothetical protein
MAISCRLPFEPFSKQALQDTHIQAYTADKCVMECNTVYCGVKVKVTFTLEQATKAQRGLGAT